MRDLPTLKIFIIAIVWVLFCLFFPYFIESKVSTTQFVVLVTSSFLFMIAITIPFDIRDLGIDADSKRTIPQVLGEKNARTLALTLLTISQILLMVFWPSYTTGILIFCVLGLIFLSQAKQGQKDIYFSGVIDGLLVLQTFLIWLNTI
ncbi:MAG: hypothetical protein ACWA41_05525 [Putridiphycobacter sp.]